MTYNTGGASHICNCIIVEWKIMKALVSMLYRWRMICCSRDRPRSYWKTLICIAQFHFHLVYPINERDSIFIFPSLLLVRVNRYQRKRKILFYRRIEITYQKSIFREKKKKKKMFQANMQKRSCYLMSATCTYRERVSLFKKKMHWVDEIMKVSVSIPTETT